VVLYTTERGDQVWLSEDIGGESPNEILWWFPPGYSLDENIQDHWVRTF
jgi:hypothetical protein